MHELFTLHPAIFNLAKQYNLNLSAFLEHSLVAYFNQLKTLGNSFEYNNTPDTHKQDVQPSRKAHGKTTDLYDETDLSGFEPESEAPEASVISKLHYRSNLCAANQQGD